MAEDRRVRRTRRLLQDALRGLLLEKGYDQVSVQDILDRADVGRATFYAHFRDKDALMMSRFEEVRASLRGHLAELARAHEGRMLDIARALFEHAAEHRCEYRTLVGSRSGNAILALVRKQLTKVVHEHFREVVEARELGAVVPIEIAANYVVSAFVPLLAQWLDSRQPQSAEDIARMFMRMTRPAITAALGLRHQGR